MPGPELAIEIAPVVTAACHEPQGITSRELRHIIATLKPHADPVCRIVAATAEFVLREKESPGPGPDVPDAGQST